MMTFRTVLVACVVPFVLSACQSAQIGSSSFSGDQLSSKPVKSSKSVAKSEAVEEKSTSTTLALANTDDASTPAAEAAKAASTKTTGKRSSKKTSMANRRAKYRPIIAKYARQHGVPVNLAMAVVEVESSFRANATGRVGEIGLMQLLPRTARYIGVKGDLKKLYDPDTNIRYGMKYLGGAHKRAGGNTCRTILKYNAGHHAKKMNPMSADYCKRVSKILARG